MVLGSGIAGENKRVAPLWLTRGPRAWRPAVLYQLLPQRLPRQLPPLPGRRLKAHAESGAPGRKIQDGIRYARGEIAKDVRNAMVSLYSALASTHGYGHFFKSPFFFKPPTLRLLVSSVTTPIARNREVFDYG